jgi:hypothetical protein
MTTLQLHPTALIDLKQKSTKWFLDLCYWIGIKKLPKAKSDDLVEYFRKPFFLKIVSKDWVSLTEREMTIALFWHGFDVEPFIQRCAILYFGTNDESKRLLKPMLTLFFVTRYVNFLDTPVTSQKYLDIIEGMNIGFARPVFAVSWMADIAEYLPDETLRRLIRTLYLGDTPEIRRAKEILSLPERFRRFCSLKPTRAEEIVFRLYRADDTRSECEKYGIIVPKNIDAMEYLKSEISLYTSCFNRKGSPPELSLDMFAELDSYEQDETMDLLTDVELEQLSGLVAIAGRYQLIETIRFSLGEPQFFISDRKRCKNRETITNLVDPRNPIEAPVVISYGYLSEYDCWEPEDIEAGLQVRKVFRQVGSKIYNLSTAEFKSPSTGRPFSKKYLKLLYELLLDYQPYVDDKNYQRLMSKIHEAIEIMSDKSDKNTAIREIHSTCTSDEQISIRSFMKEVFKLAMYLRGWDGVSEYPLKPVKLGGAVIAANMTPLLHTLVTQRYPALNEHEKLIIDNLSLYHAVDNAIVRYEEGNLFSILSEIHSGELCTELGSNILLLTSLVFEQMIYGIKTLNNDIITFY